MVGQNITRLATSVAGMNRKDVDTSRQSWQKGADSLLQVSDALDNAAVRVMEGFGEDSGVGEAARNILHAMKKDTVEPRRQDMKRAAVALEDVHAQMEAAEKLQVGMPHEAPGPAPKYQGGPGETDDDITALKIFAAQTTAHNRQVSAFGDADQKAGERVAQLNKTYLEAAKVMAEIHGEPIDDDHHPQPIGPGGGGGPSSEPPVRTPISMPPTLHPNPIPTPHPVPHPNPNPHPNPTPNPFPTPTPTPTPDPTPSPIPGPTPSPDPTPFPGPTPEPTPGPTTPGPSPQPSPGPGGGSIAAGLGVAGAGIAGSIGAKGAIGRLAAAAIGRASSAGAVGAGGRTSASGVLGRGSAVPGQSVGRGGAAGGARGAGSGRGAAGRGGGMRSAGGGAGGRGAGARGAGGGAGGRRGKKDENTGRENEYEVEEDWLDDEGNPSVLS